MVGDFNCTSATSGSATKTLEHGRSRRMIRPLLTSMANGAPVGEITSAACRLGIGRAAMAMVRAIASRRTVVGRRFMSLTILGKGERFGRTAADQIDLGIAVDG